jgi:DNA-binding transcriptional MerR regulator
VSARESAARYPIRAVSKLTGIGIDTLRAWERRHGAVTPVRDDRGRMYTDADIARLRLLRIAVEHGHSIGRLAGLGSEELRHLTATATAAPPVDPQPAAADAAALSQALREYDAVGIDQEIARLASVLRPIDLLRAVLMPVLVQIGDDWHQDRIGIAQEHLMSAAVRHILGSFLRLHARREAPAKLLFATLPGDRHEIGTLGAAMLAASSGLGVVYLGPDLPTRDIVNSVTPANAQVLVIGMTTISAGSGTERALRAIVRDLPLDVELWTGGHGAERHAAIIKPRGLVFGDYTAYQQELVRLGGRVV